jgi:hypothetical protein
MLPVPETLLPKPRMIVCHGDVETKHESMMLEILKRTADSVSGHKLYHVTTAGGNDWTGWHIEDAGAIQGMHDVLVALQPPTHWKIEIDL